MKNSFDYPIDRAWGPIVNFIWLKKIESSFYDLCLLYEHFVSADVDILIAIISPRKSYEDMLKLCSEKLDDKF